jgi:TetR/AcrR family transcriptional regulator, tetracycline repressor protein
MTTEKRRSRHGDLPWPAAARPTEGREPLTRDEIVAGAIRLADAEGLAALSMRRLGQELGAGATSLYWHVRNKDQLEDLMIDALIGEVAAEIAPAEGWRGQLAEVARALRRVLLRHRHVAPLLGARPTIGPHALDAAERVMGILRDAGFDDRTTSLASGGLINYASGFALFESRSPGGAPDSPERQEVTEAVMAYFQSLPPERYPNLLAVARARISEDDQFEYGLQRLLDGFDADLVRGTTEGWGDDGEAGPNAMLLR